MAVVTLTNHEQTAAGAPQTSTVVGAAQKSIGLATPLIATALVLIAAILMWIAYAHWIKPSTIMIATGYVPFAGVIVLTAAIERLLEPLGSVLNAAAPSLNSTSTKTAAAAARSVAETDANNTGVPRAQVQQDADAAATAQAAADSLQTKRAMVFWAIASTVGLGVSGGFGFFLLGPLSTSHVNSFLDLAVTGLAIGAGTKPLHDLITSVQSKATAASS